MKTDMSNSELGKKSQNQTCRRQNTNNGYETTMKRFQSKNIPDVNLLIYCCFCSNSPGVVL